MTDKAKVKFYNFFYENVHGKLEAWVCQNQNSSGNTLRIKRWQQARQNEKARIRNHKPSGSTAKFWNSLPHPLLMLPKPASAV